MVPAISNAKANLTTVSNHEPAPAVVNHNTPRVLAKPIILFRSPEAPKAARSVVRVIHLVETPKPKKAVVKRTVQKKSASVVKKSTQTRVVVRAGRGPSASSNWGTPGQCTWGALNKWHRATGWYLGGFHGNAYTWNERARAAGHSVGYTPRARSVVVFEPGVAGSSSVGHVAWVTSVSGSSITIVEMNAMAGPFNYNTRTLKHRSGMSYIYAP
jgi:surface antigen